MGFKYLPSALMHSIAVRRSLNTRASIVSRIILTYKDFDGTGHGKHDSGLVHIVDILYQNGWIL